MNRWTIAVIGAVISVFFSFENALIQPADAFPLSETSPCTYSATASASLFGGSGGTGTILITSAGQGCEPAVATKDVPWIKFRSVCGSDICETDTMDVRGETSFAFRIMPNQGNQTRTGTISIPGSAVSITQKSRQDCTTCGTVFSDVGMDNWAYANVNGAGCAGITLGCGNGKYCPTDAVTREQMAAFIIRAKEGETPPGYGTASPSFADVSASNPFFRYIERIADLRITLGCGGENFCPAEFVTRGQMAAFIIRALYGEDFTCTETPYFSDVPETNGFFKYVQKLKDDGITTETGVFGVDGIVTRDQMSAFIYRAFVRSTCSSQACTADLSATVRNSLTGEPVAGAMVIHENRSGITGTGGLVSITGIGSVYNNTRPGFTSVVATGYVPASWNFVLTCGIPSFPDLLLTPTNPGSFSLSDKQTHVLTPNGSHRTGVFPRIFHNPATGRFTVVYQGYRNGTTGTSFAEADYAYREYDTELKETGLSGVIGLDVKGDYAMSYDGTHYYFLYVPTMAGFELVKFAPDFSIAASTPVPFDIYQDAGNDMILNYTGGILIAGSLYDTLGTGPDYRTGIHSGTTYPHLFFRSTTMEETAASRYLMDESNIPAGAGIIYNDGVYHLVTANRMHNSLLYVYQWDAGWNYLGKKLLSANGQWSQGIIHDNGRYYVVFHTGIHTNGNVALGVYDSDWNLAEMTLITAYSEDYSAQRPWIIKANGKIYISYDVATGGDQLKDWQAHVAVYTVHE